MIVREATTTASGTVDFDLHGLVGIRLLGAEHRDARAVQRQLGLAPAPLARQPDIVVRFVDEIPLSSTLRYLGLDDAGFTDDAFLVLRAKHKSRAKVQIPLQHIGRSPEILCERGVVAVPLLVAIVNLTALGKGYLPLHAAAFRYQDAGIVTTGWSKGGKTEALLAFMSHGAQYVGDEWVYFSADAKRMFGIPEPIRVWKWYLDQLPEIRARAGGRVRLNAWATALRCIATLTADGHRRDRASRALQRLAPLARKQLCVDVAPERIFGPERCARSANVDHVFFVASQEHPATFTRPADPAHVAERMVWSLQEELVPFMSYYHKMRFAFPELDNEIVENSRTLQRAALHRLLDGRVVHEVLHPYPASLSELYESMSPLVGRRA